MKFLEQFVSMTSYTRVIVSLFSMREKFTKFERHALTLA